MFFKNIRHKHLYKKIQLLLKTVKEFTVTEKMTILTTENNASSWNNDL